MGKELVTAKCCFITGATSGIGMATAIRFASCGWRLILCGRRKERLVKLKAELERDHDCEVLTLCFDIRNAEAVKNSIDTLPENFKEIDLLVNNAGLSRGLNKIQEGDIQDWEEMIDTNIKGLLYVSRALIPLMLEAGKGQIINIGSISGREIYPAGNVYCATKFAVDALTKSMRLDLLGTPIKVSTVDPGLVETEFSNVRFRGDKDRANAVYKNIEALKPEDVADAIEFVATRSENVNIAEILLLPKAQAGAASIKRGE